MGALAKIVIQGAKALIKTEGKQLAKEAAKQEAKQVAKEAAKQEVKQVVKEESKQVAKAAAKKGNTGLNKYLDKAKEKLSKACKKAVDKFGGHIHGRKTDVTKPGQESNHMLQNAMLETARGEGSDICGGYKTSRGPAIPLDDEAHKAVTKAQGEFSKKHRDAGTQPTYGEARSEAKKQTQNSTGASKSEAECLMKFMDQVFEQLCPGLTGGGTKLRTPRR